MKQRNPWILLIILAVIVVVLIFLVNPPRTDEESEVEVPAAFTGLNVEEIGTISIKTPEATSTLVREGQGWVVTEFDNFPADQEGVEQLLEKLAGFKLDDLVSNNPDNRPVYEVDEAGIGVTVSAAGGDKAPLADFVIGKMGPDFTSTYVRLADSDEVYLVKDRLKNLFDRGPRTWRERKIFNFEPEEVLSLDLAAGEEGEAMRLEADDDRNWLITSPEESAADKAKVELVCRSFGRLVADDFAETPEDLSSIGLAEPQWSYTVELMDGSSMTLLVGSTNEDDTRHYVKRGDSPTVYLLGKYRINNLSKKPDELKPEALPPADSAGAEPFGAEGPGKPPAGGTAG